MNSKQLISELGHNLGIDLKLSDVGTCGVLFDNDEVILESHEDKLYLISDLGPTKGRENAYGRLLSANYLGQESGQATLSVDADRQEFTLHRILEGDINYSDFERILTQFVQAMHYWKEWLSYAQTQEDTKTTSYFLNEGLHA